MGFDRIASGRRQITQALFEKVYVCDGNVVEVVTKFPFDDLVEAASVASRRGSDRGSVSEMHKYQRARSCEAALLAQIAQAKGSSKASMVALARWRSNQEQGSCERNLPIGFRISRTIKGGSALHEGHGRG